MWFSGQMWELLSLKIKKQRNMSDYNKPQLVPFSSSTLTEIGYVFTPRASGVAQSRVSLTVGTGGVVNVGSGFYEVPALPIANIPGRIVWNSTQTPGQSGYPDLVEPVSDSGGSSSAEDIVAALQATDEFGLIRENLDAPVSGVGAGGYLDSDRMRDEETHTNSLLLRLNEPNPPQASVIPQSDTPDMVYVSCKSGDFRLPVEGTKFELVFKQLGSIFMGDFLQTDHGKSGTTDETGEIFLEVWTSDALEAAGYDRRYLVNVNSKTIAEVEVLNRSCSLQEIFLTALRAGLGTP